MTGWHAQKLSPRETVRRLGRSRSIISAKVRRNAAKRTSGSSVVRPSRKSTQSVGRELKGARLVANPRLRVFESPRV